MQRLIHEHAWEGAHQVLALIAHLLREEEHADAHETFYELLKAVIEGYEAAADRQTRRPRPMPGKN